MGPAKFIQIAGTRDILYALDEDGIVWTYRTVNGWVPLSNTRQERN